MGRGQMEQPNEVEVWIRALKNPSPDARADAAFGLGGVGGSRDEVVAALRTALDDPDLMVVNFAAQSLGQLRDLPSLSSIRGLLSTGPPGHRRGLAWAVEALAAIGTEQDRLDAKESLSAYLKRARGRNRAHAAGILARLESRRLEDSP